MKKLTILLILLLATGMMVFAGGKSEAARTEAPGQAKQEKAAAPAFPTKPVKLVVYLAPGGAGDVLARKFTDVASKYTDATLIVENKPGAGGIVTLEHIRNQPADGYNLMYVTKSIVAKVASTGSDIDLTREYDWIACLQFDPQCVITNVKTGIVTWKQVFDDGKAKNGNQLWVGPATGGFDHVTGQAIWEASGMSAKWVPFDSGAKAIAALIGEQAVVYVGNPSETMGKPDLRVAAICYADRLPAFPDVPTFKELGVSGVENEVMWRGFAVRKGTPDHVVKWYEDLFAKVTADPAWRDQYEKGGIDVVNLKRDRFNKLVDDDLATAKARAGN